MRELEARRLVEPIIEFIHGGKPFLGICLGLQLLFEEGEEGGLKRGLGVLPGRVVKFDLPAEYKVPHMGWNRVEHGEQLRLFTGIPDGAHFYFVHSYAPAPEDDVVLATTQYGEEIPAIVGGEGLLGVQFHPEKSQALGLAVIGNFLQWRP